MSKNMLATPVNDTLSPNAQMRSKTLNILLKGFAGMSLFLIIFLLIADVTGIMPVEQIFYFASGSMIVGAFFAYLANKNGHVYLGGSIFIFLLIAAVTVTDTPRELLVGRSLVFFIIPVMLSSFVLGSYASYLIAALVTIEHTILWIVADLDIMFNPFGMIAFFSFAYIAWQAARIMEAALEEAHRVNAHLDELVAERTQELVAANERLQELDVLKSKFVADVSHELRTPISNISIYLEMLEDMLSKMGHTIPQKTLNFMSVLQSETTRLADLINDILNASRMEQQRMNSEMKLIDGNQIVRAVAETNRPRAEEKGLAFSLTVGDEPVNLLADEDQLKQVFTNLISNAINYTEQGSIEISTSCTDNQFLVQFTDTGMGIAAEDMPHLFERFYRGKAISRSAIPGTGLGLAITKEIVALHNGSIEAQSEPNRGTTFILSFPVQA